MGEAGGGELVGEVSWGRRRSLCRLLGMCGFGIGILVWLLQSPWAGKQVVSPCGVVTSGAANLNLALLAVYPDNSPSFSVWSLALVGVRHGTCLMIHDRAK